MLSHLGSTSLVEDVFEQIGVADEHIYHPALPPRVTGSHLSTD